ncbi:pilus assembly protein [Asticcacaulis sp. EMRT-3]|uniref:TadE/TadG family type IV pilus assembly protein n=1 Tax=Asticcacaulis sp. EMRT-3 TaxID=3040349 RepID=UPI0024AEC9B6|nr:pilus assembly protein [Asticcacaulis sp. EMRT-3]MDI7774302.1 pilus assembly protein [Asticcacaulis sp. EMRT-3]
MPDLSAYLSGFQRNRTGATALEFALIAPILIMMVGGIIDYGGYFASAHAVQQTVNDAARVAISGTTADERLELAQQSINSDMTSYAILAGGQTSLSIDEGAQIIVVSLTYTPQGDSFELMPMAPGLPHSLTRTASIVRGGY